MGQGIAVVLTFAVGVAVSPVAIIAVILMLFSARARVNGPMFLLGWVAALAIVSFAAYFVADAGDPSTSSAASDTISWGTLVLGALMLGLAVRNWRNRPAPGAQPDMPRWMAVPATDHLLGGSRARATLDDLEAWRTPHDDAVMAVLFLVFGVELIAEAIPPLTG